MKRRASDQAIAPEPCAIEAFDISAGIFVRGLENLRVMLAKAEAHAASQGVDPAALLTARLAGDMYDLAAQAHWASEGAKIAVDRLLGLAPRPLAADAKSFADLHAQIDAAIAHLRAVSPDGLEAGLAGTIDLPVRGGVKSYRGDRFLLDFAIPGFYFHLTTAYGILRHEGVPLQKGDFLGM
jgi:hypothetical protein